MNWLLFGLIILLAITIWQFYLLFNFKRLQTKLNATNRLLLQKEIEQKQELEKALAKSEERYRYFYENAPIKLHSIDERDKIISVSNYWLEKLGYEREEVINRKSTDFLTEESRRYAQEVVLPNFFQTGKCDRVPYQMVCKNGTILDVLLSAIGQKDDSGQKIIRSLAVIVDISEQKQIERVLRESEERLQLALEGSGDGWWDWNLLTGEIYLSPRWFEMLGYQIGNLPETFSNWQKLIHPEDRMWAIETLNNYLEDSSIPYTFEYRMLTQSGLWKWIANYGEIVERDFQGNPLRMVGIHRDIHERKQTEELLRKNASKERAIARILEKMRQSLKIKQLLQITTQEIRQILNCDRVALYQFNPDWNGKFVAESVGEDWNPLVGENIQTIIEDTHLKETQGGRYRFGESFTVDDIYTVGHADCHIALLEQFQAKAYAIVPVFIKNDLWGLLAAYQNSGIRHWEGGEVKLLEQVGHHFGLAIQQAELLDQLAKAKEIAENANLAKSRFLANMSHELRTPLNAVLGFTQLMQRDESLSPENKQNLTIINRSGQNLLELIDDILEMSKIEAGQITLNENSFDLYYLLDSLEEMFSLKAKSRSLDLILNRDPDLPQYIKTDEGKLRQVLINLLSNAIKFTPEGSVSLYAKTTTQKNRLYFAVEDTGVGISPDEIDKLFNPFEQTEAGRKSQEGTGLGLPISQNFVRLMGGELVVMTNIDRGTTFSFEIAFKLVETSEIARTQKLRVIGLEANQPQYRILVVDDRLESRILLTKLLSSVGFQVKEAENGQAAITIWQNWEPHLIWMDMRMPILDGYEATRIIKAHTKGQAIAIIALTASAFEEERHLVLDAGCDDFVRKPFSEEVLWEKMAQHLGVRYIYAEPNALPTVAKNASAWELSPESLKVMPAEWLEQVYQAADRVNNKLLFGLIEQIPPEHKYLATELANLVSNFRCDKILDLIEGSRNQ